MPIYYSPLFIVEVAGTLVVALSLFLDWFAVDFILGTEITGTYLEFLKETVESWEWKFDHFMVLAPAIVAFGAVENRVEVLWKPIDGEKEWTDRLDQLFQPIIGLGVGGYFYWKFQNETPISLTGVLGNGFYIYLVGNTVIFLGSLLRIQSSARQRVRLRSEDETDETGA